MSYLCCCRSIDISQSVQIDRNSAVKQYRHWAGFDLPTVEVVAMTIPLIVACRRMCVGQSRLLGGWPDIECGEDPAVVGEGGEDGQPEAALS